MADGSTTIAPDLLDYLRSIGVREPAPLRALRADIEAQHRAHWHMPPEQAAFIAFLLGVTGARRVIEVGTFAGYGTLAMALALPDDGKVVSLELNEEFASLGQPHWVSAGVANKIDLRLGDAAASLAAYGPDDAGTFDFAFIDADKKNYARYYDLVWPLVRVGGIIAVDNVLWKGRVIDPDNTAGSTRAIRALNERLIQDQRIMLSTVPIGDGLTLARKLSL
ncbi:MAG: class I SAM-dependent methyltransferase [Pseudomonadota bacterium]